VTRMSCFVNTRSLLLGIALVLVITIVRIGAAPARQTENLGRGVVALNQGAGKAFVSWRILGTEPNDIAFNLYRATGTNPPIKLTPTPLTGATCYQDSAVDLSQDNSYLVRAVVSGHELEDSQPFLNRIPANSKPRPYFPIRLQPGAAVPNDASVGDLDGDGEYEIGLKREDGARDNSRPGTTGETLLEAYRLDGTFLWRINLGKNIRGGAHYTQFMVYDLDGDGRAEIVCKTADGTTDGTGKVIGDPRADYVSREGDTLGKIVSGPEFLTVFEGATGKALFTTDYYPPRGDIGAWGSLERGGRTDHNGNRADRFLACVAYLDGVHPSVVMCRGYYGRAVLAAWNWDGSKLSRAWTFDTEDPAHPENRRYRGQGNHGLSVADVDGDGKDEIVYGAAVINHDGAGLYSTGLGHGDAMHISVLDPALQGLQVWAVHETPSPVAGAEFRDARTGLLIWGKPTFADNGRGLCADIDPRYPGCECWSAGVSGLFSAQGRLISERKPRPCNFALWWDGRLLRNLLDRNTIYRWNWETSREEILMSAEECTANNGSKATPCLSADIFGDWREEVIWRTTDNQELRIYTTTLPTEHRLYTLMHDPQYRLSVAWQNVSYNQPPHPGFYLGHDMPPPPRPNITLAPARKRQD